MKPAWDELGSKYADSASVLIADVDCTVEESVCSDNGVSGYPTIKYYTSETGRSGESYSGGRDSDALSAFVEETFGARCNVSTLEDCDEKAKKYIEKMRAKGADAQTAELSRLQGLQSGKMAADKQQWLNQRAGLLKAMQEL